MVAVKVQMAMSHHDLTEILGKAREVAMEKDLDMTKMVIVIEGNLPGYSRQKRTVALDNVRATYMTRED